MEAFFWAALAFLVVAASGGLAFVALRGWRAWQAFATVAAGLGAGLERLAASVERLVTHADRTSTRAEELAAAVAHLQRTKARATILLGATGDVRQLLRLARAFVPLR